jgi:hypothetical protein
VKKEKKKLAEIDLLVKELARAAAKTLPSLSRWPLCSPTPASLRRSGSPPRRRK